MLLDAPMSPIVQVIAALPFLALACLGLNLIVLWTISQIVTRRNLPAPIVMPTEQELPHVLIQLPVFNEASVVARVIAAMAALDWPCDLLHIQLLDDSTDETTAVAAAAVEAFSDSGFDVAHIRRRDRHGFKAGALANGLNYDDSPFIAIFDADFIPGADFLRRAMAPLLNDPRLAFVQARWDHLNADENALTASQAMMIDAHFVVEQRVRSHTSLVLPFNGTCGVWRRAAIEEAGGWAADTLCEDLDLSIRTRLCGWRATFLPDLAVPGELPATLAGWRAQQFRWTKGFVQVARKLLGRVWRSNLPLTAKIALTMQTGQTACYPLTVLSVIGTLVLLTDPDHGATMLSLFGGIVTLFGIGGSALCLITASIVLKRCHWTRFPLHFATILLLNAGLMVSNSRAVVEALMGTQTPFVRTPKRGALGAGLSEKTGPTGLGELLLGGGLAVALAYEAGWFSPLFSLSIIGLILVGAGLARERWIAMMKRVGMLRAGRDTGDQPAG
jgi:cellulose synthase/poly-beta-1,6-N-acetylglucosamine synthase-like glycosyltransferase